MRSLQFINIECVASCVEIETYDTEHHWVPSNTPARCEVDQMNGSEDIRMTNTHTQRA